MNRKFFYYLSPILLLTKSISAGDYGDVYSAHPKAGGMANSITAIVGDSSSVYYNVAGLGRMNEADEDNAMLEKRRKNPESSNSSPGNFRQKFSAFWAEVKSNNLSYAPSDRPQRFTNEVSLQYNYANPRLVTSSAVNQDNSKLKNDYAGLGLAMNLNNIYDFKRTIRFGLNVIAPATGNLLTVNDVNNTSMRYLQYGVSNEKPTIMGGLGVELWKDRLFAGVGFTALASGNGAILLKDVPLSKDRVIPNQQVILEVKPLINPTYGIQFQYGKFAAGVSYRREIMLSVNSLPARAQTTLLGIQLDFDVALWGPASPKKWTYGIAYKPTDKLTFTLEANRELWSDLGTKNKYLGTLFMSRTKATYAEPLTLVDVTVIRGGAEFKWNDYLKFRAGYARRPKATPVMPGTNNIIDFDRLIITTGSSLTLFPGMKFLENLKNPLVIDFMIEYQKLHGLHIQKYIPNTLNPNYSAGGNVWHFGLAVTSFF